MTTWRLRPLLALARRELLGHWRAPRAYVLLAFYLFVQGFLFSLLVVDAGSSAFRLLCRDLCTLWVLLGPAVASGCLAGDRSSGELATFLDAPLSERELVAGKALGLLGLVAPLVLGTLLPAAAAAYLGAPVPPLVPGILGVALLALATASAGVLASSLAAHTASATVMGAVLVLVFAGSGVHLSRAGAWATPLAGASPASALNPFWLLDGLFQGVLDSRPLLVFPAFVGLCLVAAAAFLRAERAPAHRVSSRGATILGAIALPLVGFLVVQQFALRFPWTWDLTDRTELVEPLLRAARELPSPLVIHRSRPPGRTRHDALDDLLDAIRRQAPQGVQVRELRQADYLSRLRPKGLLVPPRGGVVLELGDSVRHLTEEELRPVPEGAADALVQALQALAQPGKSADLRIAVGHGEPDGLVLALQRTLAAQGFLAEPVRLATLDPGDLAPEQPLLLVGPRISLAEGDLEILRGLLDAGGRLLLCLDPTHPSIAAELLPLFDAKTEGGVVADPRAHLAGAGPAVLLAETVDHALTRPLGRVGVLVPTALSIRPRLPGNRDSHPVLVASVAAKRAPDSAALQRPESWTFEGGWGGPPFPTGQLRQVLGMAREGPLLTAPFRAVVLGDSDLFSPEVLQSYPANAAFLRAVVSWLAEGHGSTGRHPQRVRPALSEGTLATLLHATATLPALLALAAGFFAWRRYRRRLLADDRDP